MRQFHAGVSRHVACNHHTLIHFMGFGQNCLVTRLLRKSQEWFLKTNRMTSRFGWMFNSNMWKLEEAAWTRPISGSKGRESSSSPGWVEVLQRTLVLGDPWWVRQRFHAQPAWGRLGHGMTGELGACWNLPTACTSFPIYDKYGFALTRCTSQDEEWLWTLNCNIKCLGADDLRGC